jgi:hypothetical protein
VNASSQERANKVFDRISVEVTGNRSKVSGMTQLGNMSFNNIEFSIDYYIMMPKSLGVDIHNSFGEIFVEEVDGPAQINLEYGEMDVMAFNGPSTEITLKFSEGSLDYMKDGEINIEYGEFDIEGGNNLEIRSQFSELTVEKSESIILDSQYDDLSFGVTGNMDIIGRFSDIEVDKLNGNFMLDLQYGAFDADYIFPEFTNGSISAAFTEVSLTFDPQTSFQVDAEMKFCSLSYPSGSSVSHKEEGYVTNLYKGIVGSDESTSAKLEIDSKNGDVYISF